MLVENGTAVVDSLALVMPNASTPLRRLSDFASTITVAIFLSAAPNGDEKLSVRAIAGLLLDASGNSAPTNAVIASGALPVGAPVVLPAALVPPAAAGTTLAAASSPAVVVPAAFAALLFLLLLLLLCAWRRRKRRMRKIGPNYDIERIALFGPRVADNLVRSHKALTAELTPNLIANHGWLVAESLSGDGESEKLRLAKCANWLDSVADAGAKRIQNAQPAVHIPPSLLKAAHAVHQLDTEAHGGEALGGPVEATDDLTALVHLKEALTGHPQQRAIDLALPLASACCAEFATIGEERIVESDATAVQIVLDVVESHLTLGKATVLAEACTRQAIQARFDEAREDTAAAALSRRLPLKPAPLHSFVGAARDGHWLRDRRGGGRRGRGGAGRPRDGGTAWWCLREPMRKREMTAIGDPFGR